MLLAANLLSANPAAAARASAYLLYDGQCGFCSLWAQFWEPTLERHGFRIAPLQDPESAEKLRLPPDALLADICLLTASGKLISGADAYLYVARRIWWARPFYALFRLPAMNRLIHASYRWFARNRYSISNSCKLRPRYPTHPEATRGD